MERDLSLAYWALERLRSEELPALAADWLVAGLDSPTLRELAGIDAPAMSEVGPLFRRALHELDIHPPRKEEALHVVARHHAKRIVDGVVSPYEGARRIWWEVTNEFERPSQLLLSFVGAASELEDLPERTLQDGYDRTTYTRELEDMIVSSARELLSETEPNKALDPTRVSRPASGKVSGN